MNRVVCWLTGISRIGRESAIRSRDSPTLDFVIDATEVLTSAGGGALLAVWTGTGFADDAVSAREFRSDEWFNQLDVLIDSDGSVELNRERAS